MCAQAEEREREGSKCLWAGEVRGTGLEMWLQEWPVACHGERTEPRGAVPISSRGW